MSGLAMLKYVPRSFHVKQVDGLVYRNYALRRRGDLGHRELLREVWLRFSHARQIRPGVSARRGYRSLVPALHQRKVSSTRSMVRLLAEKTFAMADVKLFLN
jgi:hypothetical protein